MSLIPDFWNPSTCQVTKKKCVIKTKTKEFDCKNQDWDIYPGVSFTYNITLKSQGKTFFYFSELNKVLNIYSLLIRDNRLGNVKTEIFEDATVALTTLRSCHGYKLQSYFQ